MTDPIIAAANFVQGNNEFALNLYSRLAQAEKSNLFFSPYSISSALAMTFAGACGRTEQEMATVLRFPTDQDDVHPAFAKLNELIFGDPHAGYTINVANRLWGQSDFKLGARFVELLRTRYGADLEQMDFIRQPELACQKINEWVEDQTAGKITNLISPNALKELTHLLLVNAVYFKGDWTETFDVADTAVTGYLCSVIHDPVPVPVFCADHPFVFMIRHNESGSILFLGRVVNPED